MWLNGFHQFNQDVAAVDEKIDQVSYEPSSQYVIVTPHDIIVIDPSTRYPTSAR